MINGHLACIKWDQKLGGVVESVVPNLKISPSSAMNLYNLHRMRQTGPSFGSMRLKLEKGDTFNVATFFSGFGGTSPDGFTANYGKNVIGISEKVFALFLPMNVKAQTFEEILAKISSRLLLSAELIPTRIEIIANLINQSALLEKPEELREFINSHLDRKLKLSSEDIGIANGYEVKALHFLIQEKSEHIRDLTINPANSAFCVDAQKIADAQANQQQVKELIAKVQVISQQKAVTDAIASQKDEMLETLKADYLKIFGTLMDQIVQLEGEIEGISESTEAFVNDLNGVLAEKIARIAELEEQLENV